MPNGEVITTQLGHKQRRPYATRPSVAVPVRGAKKDEQPHGLSRIPIG
jgi:hypothetical protein